MPRLWGTPWGPARARRALKVPAACRIEGRACEVGRGAARKAAVRGAVATQTACAGRARLKAGAQGTHPSRVRVRVRVRVGVRHAPVRRTVDGVGGEEAHVTPVLDCAADGLTLLAHGHAEAGEAAGDRRLQTDRAAAWVECTARYAVRTAHARGWHAYGVRTVHGALGQAALRLWYVQHAGGWWRPRPMAYVSTRAATDDQDPWRPRGQERAGES